jgi:fructose-1,6-bisphosphatase I
MGEQTTLADWLATGTAPAGARDLTDALRETLQGIAAAAVEISAIMRRGTLGCADPKMPALRERIETQVGTLLRDAARALPVAWYATSTAGEVAELTPGAPLALATDPLDGVANIEANVSTGTIFSIYPADRAGDSVFLRPGHEQVAAGYVMYGAATVMVLTVGQGTAQFVLDPASETFVLTDPALLTPTQTNRFAINSANYRHWESSVRNFIDDLVEGEDGPRGRNFDMRWVASLTAETHRVLTQGGIFLYPRDNREGHERGTLQHVFGVAPIAFIAEQAGGAATNGESRVLDLAPEGLQDRAPLIFGSRDKVDMVRQYHENPDFQPSLSPLFGVRGLFRT